ncbi:hypothetical protein ATO2_13205 [Roseovarius sp. 22II1-1F6A]|nr:hypothetical protein ATO2_13205 [Roseovarius sp. 22II1-1F6A]
MTYLNKDTWVGLVMLLVAGLFWREASHIRISPLDDPVGAAGLPKTLAVVLAVLAVLLLIRAIVGAAMAVPPPADAARAEPATRTDAAGNTVAAIPAHATQPAAAPETGMVSEPVQQADPEAKPATPSPALATRMKPHLRAIVMLGLGVGYLLVVTTLGYALSVMALIFLVSLYIGAPLGLRTVLVAVLGGLAFQLLFVQFLGIPLPGGIVASLLSGLTG